MGDAHHFLQVLTTVLGVAALTTIVFQRLRQPVVLGYLLAGLIVGPHVPIPLVADLDIVHTLSELGVILLMFSLGLEFSVRKLVAVGPTAGLTAFIQSSLMLWLGYLCGRAFGWTPRECLFTGAIIAISSTTIIAKAFDEQRIGGRLRELVVGVLVVEDLIAILLMALLTALASGQGVDAWTVARSAGRLAGFLVLLIALGMLVVPRAMRAVVRLGRPETTVITAVGLCFGVALLARELGYSVALGAFVAGSLVAESGEEKGIEQLILPIRELFAAIFFVSVGMLIEPALVVRHAVPVVVLGLVVTFGKVLGVTAGAFLTGNGTRTSVQAGMSLAQIGEFSFIIAGLGVELGATRPFLYPIAVAVSALTTLTTPWLIRAAGPVASFVEERLPQPLQTLTALYGSWIEQLRTSPRATGTAARVRRLVVRAVFDTVLLAAVIIGAAVSAESVGPHVAARLGVSAVAARVVVIAAAVALAAPFVIGLFRIARALGLTLAEIALPRAAEGSTDLAAAPRRALVVTLQLAVVLLFTTPLLALTQPFVPGWTAAVVLVAVVLAAGVGFWRGAANLQGHVRAGAQIVVDALISQARKGASRSLAQVTELLPGLGGPVPLAVAPNSPAAGKSLAELDFRGVTGATVLAIARGEEAVLVPTSSFVLLPGDVLAVAGAPGALEAARALLDPVSLARSGEEDL